MGSGDLHSIVPVPPPSKSASLAVLAIFILGGCGGRASGALGDGGSPDSGVVIGPSDGGCASGISLPIYASTGCTTGQVKFQLIAPTSWMFGQSADTNAPSANWLTIHCPSGALIDLRAAEDTPPIDCRACGADNAWGVAIGSSWGNVPDGGQTGAWDGTFFAPGICPGASQSCLTPACALPGHYEAEMCACSPAEWQSGDCQKGVGTTCVNVPFEYPSSTIVAATIPPAGDP
jgi:hypothetical protein